MDSTIITLVFSDEYPQADFEVPLKLGIGELESKLLDALKEMDFEHFNNYNEIKLKFSDNILNSEKTLEQYGVWDGSYLSVMKGD